MSMSLICLVSKPSNHSKVIKNNVNGFEFDLNYYSFSELMRKIINIDQSKKKKIQYNARNSVKKLIRQNEIFERKIKNMFFSNHS